MGNKWGGKGKLVFYTYLCHSIFVFRMWIRKEKGRGKGGEGKRKGKDGEQRGWEGEGARKKSMYTFREWAEMVHGMCAARAVPPRGFTVILTMFTCFGSMVLFKLQYLLVQ